MKPVDFASKYSGVHHTYSSPIYSRYLFMEVSTVSIACSYDPRPHFMRESIFHSQPWSTPVSCMKERFTTLSSNSGFRTNSPDRVRIERTICISDSLSGFFSINSAIHISKFRSFARACIFFRATVLSISSFAFRIEKSSRSSPTPTIILRSYHISSPLCIADQQRKAKPVLSSNLHRMYFMRNSRAFQL
jgi:hypothetical protein